MDLEALAQKRTLYSIPGMERAIVRKDLTYKTVDDTPLKLDLYYPPDYEGDEALATVILVHGEWPPGLIERSKDLGGFVSLGQLVAASGLIGVNFNHRSVEGLHRRTRRRATCATLWSMCAPTRRSLG